VSGAATELSVSALRVRFERRQTAEAVTFEVRGGEVMALIGPNGAGKTSAFNAITGYIVPSAGDIRYRGTRLNGLKPSAIAALGLVRTFQKTSVFAGQTVRDNVLIGLHLRGRQRLSEILLGVRSVAREERALAERAGEIMDFVGLSARGDRLAAALPYGELRLLEVAIALAAAPRLLLLDEPVSGMNPVETKRFMALLARVRAQGVSVLLRRPASVQRELARRSPDRRCDQASVGDGDAEQLAVEVARPEVEEFGEAGEARVHVVVLPHVRLQQRRVVGEPVEDHRGRQT